MYIACTGQNKVHHVSVCVQVVLLINVATHIAVGCSARLEILITYLRAARLSGLICRFSGLMGVPEPMLKSPPAAGSAPLGVPGVLAGAPAPNWNAAPPDAAGAPKEKGAGAPAFAGAGAGAPKEKDGVEDMGVEDCWPNPPKPFEGAAELLPPNALDAG